MVATLATVRLVLQEKTVRKVGNRYAHYLCQSILLLKVNSKMYVIDIDECLKTPCQNGGLCVNNNGSYTCNCSAGFTGKDCEKGSIYNHNIYVSLFH